MYFAVAVVIRNIVKGIAGLVFTMPSPPVDVLVTAQPVVLSGRGQTAQAQTIQTGIRTSQPMVKSTLCLRGILFGMDSQAMKDSSSYAKHVSFRHIFVTLICPWNYTIDMNRAGKILSFFFLLKPPKFASSICNKIMLNISDVNFPSVFRFMLTEKSPKYFQRFSDKRMSLRTVCERCHVHWSTQWLHLQLRCWIWRKKLWKR